MTHQFLNTKRLFLAKIHQGLFSPEIRRGHDEGTPSFSGYTLVKPFVNESGRSNGRGGVYKSKTGKLVTIKAVPHHSYDMMTEYIHNEVSVFSLLEKLYRTHGLRRLSPKLLFIKEETGSLAFSTAFVRGQSIASAAPHVILQLLTQVLRDIAQISRYLSASDRVKMAKRTWGHYALSYSSHLVNLLFTQPQKIKLLFHATRLFVGHVSSLRSATLSLIHRDLDPNNILVTKEKRAIVTDWESAVFSDPLYDLADVSRLYFKVLTTKQLYTLIGRFTKTRQERERFIALTAFNTIQTLSISGPESRYGRDAVAHFNVFQNEILPQFKKEKKRKTLYERVNAITLRIIAEFNERLRLDAVFPTPALILCYHSVSDSGWRFSTPVREFSQQIAYLKRRFTVTTLSTLVREGFPAGHIAITFDDGYADVYQNALPILKRYGLPATVFAIGDRANVNRTEIDNRLPLMTTAQLKALIRCGWEIGFHTARHPDLRKLNNTELTREITTGKQTFEKKIGSTLRYFAYPRGLYTDDVLNSVAKAGFQAAFTVDGGTASGTRPLLVDRIPLEGNASEQDLKALLSPPGLLVERLFFKILQIKESAVNLFTNPAPTPAVQ